MFGALRSLRILPIWRIGSARINDSHEMTHFLVIQIRQRQLVSSDSRINDSHETTLFSDSKLDNGIR